MRLINAFELKQRILEERDKIPLTLPGAVYEFGIEKPNHYGNAMRGGIRKALRCMEQCYNYTLAEGINLTQRWIPVSERLPFAEYGESEDVLTVDEWGLMQVLYFDGGCWCYPTGETFMRKITHWMPLPEPPTEQN